MKPLWLIVALAANIGAASLDLATTHRALAGGGGREANPVMASGRGTTVKVAFTIGISSASVRLWRHGHPKAAVAASLIPAAVSAGAAISNRRYY
jgi:hypothetical protein